MKTRREITTRRVLSERSGRFRTAARTPFSALILAVAISGCGANSVTGSPAPAKTTAVKVVSLPPSDIVLNATELRAATLLDVKGPPVGQGTSLASDPTNVTPVECAYKFVFATHRVMGEPRAFEFQQYSDDTATTFNLWAETAVAVYSTGEQAAKVLDFLGRRWKSCPDGTSMTGDGGTWLVKNESRRGTTIAFVEENLDAAEGVDWVCSKGVRVVSNVVLMAVVCAGTAPDVSPVLNSLQKKAGL